MDYRVLVRGVRLYDGTEPRGRGFPSVPFEEEDDYLDAIDQVRAGDSVEAVAEFVNHWRSRTFVRRRLLRRILGQLRKRHHRMLSSKLSTVELVENRDFFVSSFHLLKETMNGTAVAKALHLVSPDLFMPWDGAIREEFGCAGNGEGYFNFLWRSQSELREILESYHRRFRRSPDLPTRLYSGRKKSILKLLDEANWEFITGGEGRGRLGQE